MNAWISRCMALVMLAAVFGGGCSSSESSTDSDPLRVRVAEGFREERCAWWKGYYDSLFE
ncbi:MAG: hypothetical protein WBN70_16995 [Polyangiales bacterium]